MFVTMCLILSFVFCLLLLQHDELLARNGLYAQLWHKQKGTTSRGNSANNLAALADAAGATTAK